MTHKASVNFGQAIKSKMNPEIRAEIREMLLGHNIGLASAYYRPVEEDSRRIYESRPRTHDIQPRKAEI